MRYVRRSAAIEVLLIAGLAMAPIPEAGAATSHRTSSRPVAVSIPKGWQSYAYGGVTNFGAK